MADLITNQLLTSNYADCQLGPFGQVKSFLYSVFQVSGDLGGAAVMQCAIGKYPGQIFWEDIDRPRYPMIGARVSNVYGIRFKQFPGNPHAVRVSVELDTPWDPEIADTGISSGALAADGTFTPFSPPAPPGASSPPFWLPCDVAYGQLSGSGTTITNDWHIMSVENPAEFISRGISLQLNRGSSDLIANFAIWEPTVGALIASIDQWVIPKSIGPGVFRRAWDGGDADLPSGPLWFGTVPQSGTGSGWFTRFSQGSPVDFKILGPIVITDPIPDPIDPTTFTAFAGGGFAQPVWLAENTDAPTFGTLL